MRKRNIVKLLIAIAMIAFGIGSCSLELAPAGTSPADENPGDAALRQNTNDWNVPVSNSIDTGTESPESENVDNPSASQDGASGNEQRDSGTITPEPESIRQDAGAPDGGFTANTEIHDAGFSHDAGNSENNTSPPPVLETPNDGVLVMANEPDVSSSEQQEPENHADAPAGTIANPSGLASVTDNDGHVYSIRAFPKATTETLENWNARSYYGNSFATNVAESTANGYTAVLYGAGDDGSFPEIHALIATGEFVYRIDWTNPAIPRDFAATVELLQENREQYFFIPDHFKRFVHGLTVR